MPYEFKLGAPPVGYLMNRIRPGMEGEAAVTGFASSDDGEWYLTVMDGWPASVLAQCPDPARRHQPSVVDFLAVIDRSGEGTAYLNETTTTGSIQVKTSIAKGEAIVKDQIADVHSLDPGVEIPPDAGFFYCFSVGWLRGVFFDFAPFAPDGVPRVFDPKEALGGHYAYMLFRERFKISREAWVKMTHAGWFPFIGLSDAIVRELVQCCEDDAASPDEILAPAEVHVRRLLPMWKSQWPARRYFANHAPLLVQAIDRFEAGDYVSACAILFPRIEGILRATSTVPPSRGDKGVIAHAVTKGRSERSALLPRRFRRYLTDVYLRKPGVRTEFLSRNSVSHGDAPPDTFNLKGAILALLTIDQLTYFLSAQRQSPEDGSKGDAPGPPEDPTG